MLLFIVQHVYLPVQVNLMHIFSYGHAIVASPIRFILTHTFAPENESMHNRYDASNLNIKCVVLMRCAFAASRMRSRRLPEKQFTHITLRIVFSWLKIVND